MLPYRTLGLNHLDSEYADEGGLKVGDPVKHPMCSRKFCSPSFNP